MFDQFDSDLLGFEVKFIISQAKKAWFHSYTNTSTQQNTVRKHTQT